MKIPRTHRRQLSVVAVAAFLVAAGGCHSSSSNVLDPAINLPELSPIIEDTRPVSGVNAILMDGVGEVFIHQDVTESLMVRTEELILPLIRTENVGGELVLGFNQQVNTGFRDPVIEFHVGVTNLWRISLPGIGAITADGIEAATLELVKSGIGGIEVNDLDATRLELTQTGTGIVNVSGGVLQQDIDLGGFGNYNALSLTSQVADVAVRGFGSATVNVSETLNAQILSSGNVFYAGNPVVNVSGNGSGHCEPVN